MYESFFGLNEKPFNLTPDPRYFYLSESHREALAALIYGVREEAGLVSLTGPVGVGKTMILASFLDQIREHSKTALFSGAIAGNRTQFLRDLCSELGFSPEQDSTFGLSQDIKDFAIQQAREGGSVVVVVDEAQDLGPEELEHFHHLSNLETPEAKLVQIVLAGTERLDERLGHKSLEALWQRVAIRCVVERIEPEETIAYIFHRLQVAGCSTSGLFSEDALWRIVNFTRGVPRLINLVCNQAMIWAYSSGRRLVDEDAVMAAIGEFQGGQQGVGTQETVGQDEIRGMVERVSRRQEEGALPSEGERDPVSNERANRPGKVEVEEEEVIKIRRRLRRPSFSSRFCPRSRLSLALVLIILLSMVGVVMAIGLLKAREDGVESVQSGLSKESDKSWTGDSPRSSLMSETPKGGPENEVADSPFRLTPLCGPEVKEIRVGSNQSSARSEEDLRVNLPLKDIVPAGEKEKTIREKDVAGIALEHYGRLDVEILRTLRKKNPQVRDWNNLDRKVQLVLPDMPEPTKGGVDFYTIQVGAFREEQGASQRASELAARGVQNLFLVTGGGDKRLTFVCVGVFESGRHSLDSIGKVRKWGYEDAFPVRIKEKRLADVLRPYAGPGPGEPSVE